VLDVLAAAVLEDHALDPLPLKQETQRQPRRPGADDPYLGALSDGRRSVRLQEREIFALLPIRDVS
jgi:hypothetical protein